MERLKFDARTAGGNDEILVVRIGGHIDASTVDEFAKSMSAAIEKHPHPTVIIQLSDLEYINSSGLGVLIQASQGSERLFLAEVPSKIERIMKLLGLADLVTMYKSLDEAVSAAAN